MYRTKTCESIDVVTVKSLGGVTTTDHLLTSNNVPSRKLFKVDFSGAAFPERIVL
jgi:hypothetical protein